MSAKKVQKVINQVRITSSLDNKRSENIAGDSIEMFTQDTLNLQSTESKTLEARQERENLKQSLATIQEQSK